MTVMMFENGWIFVFYLIPDSDILHIKSGQIGKFAESDFLFK